MGNFIYKCVSFKLDVYSDEDFLTKTESAYEKILNEVAVEGWDFVKIDTITMPNPDNSVSKIVNEIDVQCTKVLIFRKYVDTERNAIPKIDFILNEEKTACPSCRFEVSTSDVFCENCGCKL